MTWTPPTKPVNWQDTPSTATAVDAANLNADESFAVTVGTSVVSYFETSTSVVSSAAQTSPLLFVEAWGAKGDTKRVTDGAITTGTNTLSSTAASFTSADTGKRVDVVGAGPAGAGAGTLFAFIGTVTSGVASLVTTSGGSTPANATSTVSGAMVTYGTEDTTAFQNAHTALTAAGGGVLRLRPGKSYFIGQVIPTSNVTVWAYGATVYLTSYSGNSGFLASVAAVNSWSLRGATIPGDNVAYGSGNRVPVFINTAGSSDIDVFDCKITNNRDAAVYLVDTPTCRVVGNRIIGCCQALGRNAINISSATTSETATDIEISGNYLKDNYTLGIHFGLRGGLSLTPNTFRAVVIGNRVFGNHATGICMEAAESGPGGPGASVTIGNNIVSLTQTGSVAIFIGNSVATQGRNIRWVIEGNMAEADAGGITINASDVTCTGNVINVTGTASAGSGISTLAANTTATATLDGTTAVLTSVTYATGANPVTNGLPITGTGIPSGSYIVSGGGTGTVTISQATTAAATETVTVALVNSNVTITGNTIHMAATSTTSGGFAGLLAANLGDSLVENNTVTFDTGGGSFSMYGLWLQNSFATSMRGNRVTNAPRWGARFTSCHDCEFSENKIRNPNQNGTGDIGVQVNATYASEVDGNRIWDDTAASKLTSGLSTTAPIGTLRARRNTILNATSTPIAGTWIELGDNRFTTGGASGRATLVAGTVTVSTAEVRSGDSVMLTRVVAGGTVGVIQLGTITAGTSFVINSVQPGTASTLQAADTSTVFWRIDH